MEQSRNAVLVLIDTGFNEIETMYAKYRLEEDGYRVFLTAPKAGERYVGRFGFTCNSEMSIYDVHERHYAGVICAGAWAPGRLRTEGTVKSLVAEMFRAGKLVAAISSGPAVMISAKICQAARMTGAASILDDLKNAGASVETGSVIVDRNIVTSGCTSDLPQFLKAVLDVLHGSAPIA